MYKDGYIAQRESVCLACMKPYVQMPADKNLSFSMEERSYRFSHRNPICGDNAQSKTPSDCLNFPSAFRMDAVSKCLKTLFYILQFVPLFRGLTEGDTLLFPGLWVWAPSACHNSTSLVTSAWCLSAPSGEITFLLFLFLLLESFTGGDSLSRCPAD